MKKLCIFGDSIAKGVMLDESLGRYKFSDKSFAALIAEIPGIEVENHARFGCTVKKGLEILEGCDEELDKYDYTLLEFGGNDCDFDWKSVSDSPDTEHFSNIPPEVFDKTYRTVIERVREKGGKPLLLTPPPIDAERYFAKISAPLVPANISKWLHEIGYIARWQEMYSLAVTRIAAECGATLIDIRSKFLQQPDMRSFLCSDGIHPNEKGHELIYEVLCEALQ